MTTNNFRHGDIDFIKEDVNVSKLKKISKNNSHVIAEGEKTGHHHCITATKGTCDVYQDKNGNMVVKIDGVAVLTHPEHKTLTFLTGTWTVKREQEYDYFAKAKRQVID
jgi:hypothetical protein